MAGFELTRRADAPRARGAEAAFLFGSTARDEATDSSDIDVFIDVFPGRKFSLIDLAAMHANVREYEPREALFVPDDDALRFYRAIARAGRRMLRPGGKLYFEIYERSAGQMRLLLGEEGYTDTEVREDLNGKPRMVCSRMK